ncbi:MAG: DUF5715 family protein [Gemmatimonadetes bacterium]|nr:DUF5715 family protein [Gemmatimonadota bacterium]
MMRRRILTSVILASVLPASAATQSLRGSSASVDRQNSMARDHDYTFLRTATDVSRFVDLGLLVPIRGNANYDLAAVSYPYGRPAVRLFIERLSAQYRSACGEKLVVTSLTRPSTRQPRNASDMSVHPAGMAVDLRISNKSSCRRWLESTLLSLEKSSVLEATRERRPAHYHIAVFATPYQAWVDQLEQRRGATVVAAASEPTADRVAESPAVVDAALPEGDPPAEPVEPIQTASYRVNRGDTLWSIAHKYATTVDELKQLNGLRSSRIAAGQKLVVPASTL